METIAKSELIWVEISKKNYIHNLTEFKNIIGARRNLVPVIKSNAYGHGLREIVSIIKELDFIKWVAVNSIQEAIFLRDTGYEKNILTLGYIPYHQLMIAVENNISITVYNLNTIHYINSKCNETNLKARIHIKLETGTNRQGIVTKDINKWTRLLKKSDNIVLEGLSTHFANIEDTTDHSYADYQIKNFKNAVKKFKQQGFNPKYKHSACSAAAILFKKTYFNMVRVGISSYGLWPSKETYLSSKLETNHKLDLKPVLTWKTRIAQIKNIPKGEYIGYGCTYKTTHKTKLAILPVGYYDGYDRHISNVGYVLIKGQRAPIRGRVCMNIIIVDVTHISNVKIEDEVVLLGKNKKENISAELMASWIGTINYEVVTSINEIHKRYVV